jgi:hypothetical protein
LRLPWPSQQVSGEFYVGVRIFPPIFKCAGRAVVQKPIYGCINAQCLFSVPLFNAMPRAELLQPVEFSMSREMKRTIVPLLHSNIHRCLKSRESHLGSVITAHAVHAAPGWGR